MRPGSRKDNIEAACTTSRKDRSDVTWVRTFIIDRQAVLAIFTHIGGRACLVGAVDAVFGDMVPDPDQVRPRLRREEKPPAPAHLPFARRRALICRISSNTASPSSNSPRSACSTPRLILARSSFRAVARACSRSSSKRSPSRTTSLAV